MYNISKGGRIMDNYQTGKQIPITLPQICAPRSELMSTFDFAAAKQYIFVEAPAGYGKTVSTILWLNKMRSKIIWLSLDKYDNTLVLFYRLFLGSILTALSLADDMIKEIRTNEFNSMPVECSIDLLSRIEFYDEKYILVLDDFHLITNQEIIKSLPYVLKRIPTLVTVIILSRSSLPESFSHLLEQEKLSIIKDNELAMTVEEIRKHFASYGKVLTENEAEVVQDLTSGWIIALNTLIMSNIPDITVKYWSQPINSYMEKHIWNKLDKEMQSFLLKTSIPDKFTVELCVLLTGNANSKEILDYFINENINLSIAGMEYSYHNLFLEFLRDKLNESGLDIFSLYKIASNYFIEHGEFITATKYAIKSRDYAIINQAIQKTIDFATPHLKEYLELNKIINSFGITDDMYFHVPGLQIANLFSLYLQGKAKPLFFYLDEFYNIMPVLSGQDAIIIQTAVTRLMLDPRIKLSQFDLFTTQMSPLFNNKFDRRVVTITFQMPFLHRSVRDFCDLTNKEISKNIKLIFDNIFKNEMQCLYLGILSGLLMEQNKLSEALELALSAKSNINENVSPEVALGVYICLSDINLLCGNKAMYEEIVKKTKEYIIEKNAQYLLNNFSAYTVRNMLFDGDKKSAQKWLNNYYVNENTLTEFYRLYQNLTTARAFIVLNKYESAMKALSLIRQLGVDYNRTLDIAEVDVLLSIVEWINGNKKEAQNRLCNVLAAMEGYGFIRVIANEGKAILPVLSSVVRKIEKGDHISEKLYRFIKDVYLTTIEQSKKFKGITIHHTELTTLKLSAKQRQVLELLAKGYKNAEITKITGLSLNTIRTHTRTLYQKLEVNNASEAVAKAKQLGIEVPQQ